MLAADSLLLSRGLPTALAALVDEPAHVATALLFLAVLGQNVARRYWVPVAVAAVAIDVDHVPAALGWYFLTEGTSRPYTHSLLTLVVVLVIAAALRKQARYTGLAVLLGLAAHLFRDLATGKVALFWPLSDYGFHLPYIWYAAAILFAALWIFVKICLVNLGRNKGLILPR